MLVVGFNFLKLVSSMVEMVFLLIFQKSAIIFECIQVQLEWQGLQSNRKVYAKKECQEAKVNGKKWENFQF